MRKNVIAKGVFNLQLATFIHGIKLQIEIKTLYYRRRGWTNLVKRIKIIKIDIISRVKQIFIQQLIDIDYHNRRHGVQSIPLPRNVARYNVSIKKMPSKRSHRFVNSGRFRCALRGSISRASRAVCTSATVTRSALCRAEDNARGLKERS